MTNICLRDLELVTGGAIDNSPRTVYRPGLGWQNTGSNRYVNPQNGGPPNQGSRRD